MSTRAHASRSLLIDAEGFRHGRASDRYPWSSVCRESATREAKAAQHHAPHTTHRLTDYMLEVLSTAAPCALS